MDLHELAVETAEKQKKADSKAFEKVLCPFITADILIKAAETIDRLGKAAQDCKSCARLPECTPTRTETALRTATTSGFMQMR